MENKETYKHHSTSKGYHNIYVVIGVIAIIIGYYHLTSYKDTSQRISDVVPGKIFEYQVKDSSKYRTVGYIAFGSDKENDGSLLYENKTAVEEANKSGKLANQIYNASENYVLSWTPGSSDSVIEWLQGLATPDTLDEPYFSQFSISAKKVSGIFRKTITGKSASSSFVNGSTTNEVRLIEIGKIRE